MASKIVVPEMGESVVGATVARWLKREGERVAAGEAVVELETEKVDLEVAAERSGILVHIDRHEGEEVKIGDVLGLIEETPEAAPQPAKVPAEPAGAAGGAGTTSAAPAGGRAAVAETGAIPAADVARVVIPSAHPQTRGVAPLTPDVVRAEALRPEERARMSHRHQTIARHLVEAQHAAAMLTTFNEIDMGAVMDIRTRHKDIFKARHGVGLGITSFFVKAAIPALQAFPRLNAEIQGEEMILKHYYDIGIAVGATEGLVVPVLRDADRLSFAQIERAIKTYARQAEDGTLSLEELRGGTFTITNGGIFGSLLSTPILNPPQVGILGLHKIEERPIAREGAVIIRPRMYVALSYDHRIVDGREAVQFLVRVKELIEHPELLLLEA
jgi:2-oxoglutarate dehydrogenase E2 component (dihydrolipoamide succinyltransferase)